MSTRDGANRPASTAPLSYRLTTEQQDLQQLLRRFLRQQAPMDRVRKSFDSPAGYDQELWGQLATELGLPALTLPGEVGGDDFGPVEMSIVMHEFGRAMAPSPYFATVVLAATALRAAGGDTAADLLRQIASGATATVAVSEGERVPTLGCLQTKARRNGQAWEITGTKTFVVDGSAASTILAFATTGDGPALFAVAPQDLGVRVEQLETLDLSRPQAQISFDGAAGRLIGDVGDAGRIFQETVRMARVALAAEQVGGAERCLEMAVEYAKTRVQFNRPIGGFQAIKHKCAELFIAVELARTAAGRAARLANSGSPEQEIGASAAAALCAETFTQVATENIHIHGGMGFTWEHDAHLFYRRAKASEVLLGSPRHARAVLLESLGV
jgi:alkylation response protein AidB-like acyl-CoA dehydrogenase